MSKTKPLTELEQAFAEVKVELDSDALKAEQKIKSDALKAERIKAKIEEGQMKLYERKILDLYKNIKDNKHLSIRGFQRKQIATKLKLDELIVGKVLRKLKEEGILIHRSRTNSTYCHRKYATNAGLTMDDRVGPQGQEFIKE